MGHGPFLINVDFTKQPSFLYHHPWNFFLKLPLKKKKNHSYRNSVLSQQYFIFRVVSTLFIFRFFPKGSIWLESIEIKFYIMRKNLDNVKYKYAITHAAKSLQLCPTLCNPIGGSPPGSPIPGILQARILEWVAISFSNAWSEMWKWSCSVSNSLWSHGLQPTRLLLPWDFPGKSTGVGCHCLLL